MKNSNIKYLVITLLLFSSVATFLTNPNEDLHKEIFKNKLNTILLNDSIEVDQNVKTLLESFKESFAQEVSKNVTRVNFYFFSRTQLNLVNGSTIIGWGFLGNVYLNDKIIKSSIMDAIIERVKQIEEKRKEELYLKKREYFSKWSFDLIPKNKIKDFEYVGNEKIEFETNKLNLVVYNSEGNIVIFTDLLVNYGSTMNGSPTNCNKINNIKNIKGEGFTDNDKSSFEIPKIRFDKGILCECENDKHGVSEIFFVAQDLDSIRVFKTQFLEGEVYQPSKFVELQLNKLGGKSDKWVYWEDGSVFPLEAAQNN